MMIQSGCSSRLRRLGPTFIFPSLIYYEQSVCVRIRRSRRHSTRHLLCARNLARTEKSMQKALGIVLAFLLIPGLLIAQSPPKEMTVIKAGKLLDVRSGR